MTNYHDSDTKTETSLSMAKNSTLLLSALLHVIKGVLRFLETSLFQLYLGRLSRFLLIDRFRCVQKFMIY